MINANPFFMSRLLGSPLRTSFSSYLSSVFTASNVVTLGHAIMTSKQVGNTHEGGLSLIMACLLVFPFQTRLLVHRAYLDRRHHIVFDNVPPS
jgi:equilibrative nucleoside transporter 1/2/3